MVFFFFSSRRRHTRWPRDWSSDVCSSDLNGGRMANQPPRLVLATGNAHKIAELARILAVGGSMGIDLVGLDNFGDGPQPAETGGTFAENALIKARAVAEFTCLPAVADDSGLCVDALN